MKNIFGVILLCLPAWAMASASVELDDVDIDLADKASLKRGAQIYAQYCQSCHSAKHMRYSRLAEDLELSEDEVVSDIVVGDRTIYDSMTTAMRSDEAGKWFLGAKPPDLSLVARSRGPEWLYTYLRGFYLDESRPFGVNNIVYKDVAMPNVLWKLQGNRKAVFRSEGEHKVLDRLKNVDPGQMSEKQFDDSMRDLVNFLVYVGEPTRMERVSTGKYVLLFLFFFFNLAYLLKKEFWKDIH